MRQFKKTDFYLASNVIEPFQDEFLEALKEIC